MDVFLRLRQLGAGVLTNPGTKFLRDLGILAFGQIGGKVLTFLTFAYLARVLDPASYGAVEFAIALTGFFAIAGDMGMGPVGVRARTAGGGIRDVEARIPAIRLLISLACIPVMIVVAHIATESNQALGLSLLFATTLPILAFNQNWFQQSLERMDRVAIGEFLRAMVFAALVILLVGASGDIFLIAAAEIVSVICLVGYFLVMQRRSGAKLSLRFRGTGQWALFRRSLPLGSSNVIWGVTYYLPPIFVAYFSGILQAAFFAAALRLVVSVQSFSYIYHFNLFASLARRHGTGDGSDAGSMAELSRASFRVIAWLLIGPAFLVMGAGGDIMALIFGEGFRTGGQYLSILILALPVQFLAGHSRWGLVAAGQNDAVFAAGFAGAIVALLILPVLTYFFAATGAAIGVVLSAIAIWMVADQKARKYALGLAPIVTVTGPVCAAIVAVLLYYLLPGWHWMLNFTASLVLYYIIGLFFDRRILPDLRKLAYAKSDQR